jgi:Glutaredoxin-like domain (DUF836)
MSLRATLYMKAECHLCEEALAELEALRTRHPHQLQRVDVTSDPDLMRRYGERIPVLVLAGREFAAPLPRPVLQRALELAEADELAHGHPQPELP